jgi:hypothetical protein
MNQKAAWTDIEIQSIIGGQQHAQENKATRRIRAHSSQRKKKISFKKHQKQL